MGRQSDGTGCLLWIRGIGAEARTGSNEELVILGDFRLGFIYFFVSFTGFCMGDILD